jgi:DNA polymerase III epsilon subunit family exonuclease
VETTGLDSGRDRIIEIGIVQFSIDPEGAILETGRWGSLINPGIPIPASSTAIHGIEDFDVWMSPSFAEVAKHVAALVEGRVMVAHNAPFDAGFVTAEFSRLGAPSPLREMADSLGILRIAYPTLISYSLGKAAFVLGLERGTSHRALDDAVTCMRIFVQSARKITGTCP